jgi:hypothetical protein
MAYSPGEQWIRLLYGYSPVMENAAMTAEHIGRLKKRTGIEPIIFPHPGKERVLQAILPQSGLPKNVIITGTAGAGKTSLCFELHRELAKQEPNGEAGIESIPLETIEGTKTLTFIYDITAWRELAGDRLQPKQVETLTTFAKSVFEEGDDFFVIGVNDGQLHEVFGYLPKDAPPILTKLKNEIARLHVAGIEDSHRLRLVNLSTISSRLLVERCLDAILQRKEWNCFETESDNPLFSPKSSLYRNFKLLQTETVRSRIITLAEIADGAGYHLPIRGILCLLVNALLGNPAARDGVLRPQQNGMAKILEQSPHEAALHRTLFGEHLGPVTRGKREIYRFLSMLQIGAETTNDLDELLIFGLFDPQLQQTYSEIVEPDPYDQRNPELPALAREYVRGELNQDDTAKLLRELAAERRRLFLTCTDETITKYHLWHTSVFHHAGDFIQKLLRPLQQSKEVPHWLTQRLVAGLNRAWTGLLLSPKPDELYLCTGLDVTTAAVSDILSAQIDITGNASCGVEIQLGPKTQQPELLIRRETRNFSFRLTLARFEFLCRVAEGTMPNSFSRESSEDFAMLKQRCIAAIAPLSNEKLINGIRITQSGKIEKAPIHLRMA